MRYILRVVLFCYFIAELLAFAKPPIIKVGEPPIITKQPYRQYYYIYHTIVLECEADGEPPPSYKWQKNGIDFDVAENEGRIEQLPHVGTLVLNDPRDIAEGMFQCFAMNKFGVATTVIVNLRQAQLAPFVDDQSVTVRPRLGESLTLPCIPPVSIPPAKLIWILENEASQSEYYTSVDYNDRVQMDTEGRLRFSNVIESDSYTDKGYVCRAENKIVGAIAFSRLYFINHKSGAPAHSGVQYMWSTPTDTVAVLGNTVVLKCIFAGNPTPVIEWLRADNKPFTDRHRINAFSTELSIKYLMIEDSADYECRATNPFSANALTRTIKLRVEAPAEWKHGYMPVNQVRTAGEKATFLCNGFGPPKPDVIWFINGLKLEDSQHPVLKSHRFKKTDAYNITIVDLIKEDTLVIQCNVTNRHGYVFANAFLNVLD